MQTPNKDIKRRGSIKNIVKQREFLLVLIIIAFIIILGSINSAFLQTSNFISMTRGFTIDGFVLIGMTFLLISGVFDISVGSNMALSAYLFTMMCVAGVPLVPAMLLTLVLGAVIGLINSLIINKINVNAFIATLAMQTILRGVVLAISQGKPARYTGDAFVALMKGSVFGLPTMFLIFIVVIILVDLVLRRIRFFRQLYFIGGNAVSAELTGISVKRTKTIFFVIIAMLAAFAGMLSASRLQGCVPNAYAGLEMKLIVACVIGGCALSGGMGTMIGSALGLIFLYILDNGLIMLKVNIYWFEGVLGVFLIVVVLINTLSAYAGDRRLKRQQALKHSQ